MEQNVELRKAVSVIIGAGYQIDKEAFEFLSSRAGEIDLDILVRNVLEEVDNLSDRPLFINRDLLERKTEQLYPSERLPTRSIETGKKAFQPYSKEIEADLKVIGDSSDKISTTGSLEDYIEYFQDRFRRLRRIMNNRMDVRDACTILKALKAPSNSKVKVVCMVTEKREFSRGIWLQVEDSEANTTVFVPSKGREVFRKGQNLVLDQIVCLCAVKGKDDFLIAEDIIFPDVPLKKPSKAPVPVCAALLSDLHVGSKMFMRDSFQRFVLWLQGKIGNSHLRQMAGQVKYVVIAGDVVDGVGIYPQQIKELEIVDIHEQYEAAAEIIEQIPDYIELVIIPGNHDAVRRALPQPALPKEYAEPLYESREIHSLGNPSVLRLHGVTVLLTHGRSLDDVISTVPGMSFQKPDEAMKFLLQCRHLAPTYGSRTLISSEKEDTLVIETVPDIFNAGHVHMMSYTTYRGIIVVNSGAWQEQTDYQREMGHTPNPGIAPVVNLQTMQVTPLSFAANT
ncbi:MAG: DNA-directed DNA polymerase II small subunit [Candidatus Bathyarchaeota archaeon]|nr:DNA-directed DNA polymerase II small subunit [Candidatus Bathyarchaeota archaeon]